MGVGFPLPPLTVTVTVRPWAVVTDVGKGDTVTVGVILDSDVTRTVFDPDALL